MTPAQRAAIKGMLAYFDSGNNIPVDKAVIRANCAEVAALRAALAGTELEQEHKPVATVKSWTNGSYWRNYKIDWHADVEEGTLLYAGQPAPQQQTVPAPVQGTSTCGRCVVFCQGGDGCLSGMSQITQIERERLVCGQLSRRTPPADVPMLTDDDLTAIYKQANGEDAGKAQPLTTQRIFKAMRAASVRQKAGLT